MLCADAVGLGKSLIVKLVAAILMECVDRVQNHRSPPPVFAASPHIGTMKGIPGGPTLIAVPGTLTDQWWRESHIYFRPAVGIFAYPNSKAGRTKFWGPNGAWKTSKHPMHRRIIITSTSTLVSEFRDLYNVPKKGKASGLPWAIPTPKTRLEEKSKGTLYGQTFGLAVVDEAQHARNPGALHSALLCILDKAALRLILTATPVHTRTEDIGAMGRLVGIPYFFTTDYLDATLEDAAELRRAKESGSVGALSDHLTTASLRLQGQFEDRVIRRVATSLGYDGQPLLLLTKLHEHLLFYRLQEWELECLEATIDQEALDDFEYAHATGVPTASFYVNERTGITYPARPRDALEDLGLEDGDGEGSGKSKKKKKKKKGEEWKPPFILSIQQWVTIERSPTKISIVVAIVVHWLSDDAVLPPRIEDGKLVLPPNTNPAGTTTNKILIYQEFIAFNRLLIDVLKLYGVDAIELHGKIPFERRGAIVHRFKTDPSVRCMILSKVGLAGLNLTEANCLVLMDQQWSNAEASQSKGRVHRQGQEKEVHIFQTIAVGSADYHMWTISQGKKVMEEAFLGSDKQKQMGEILCQTLAPPTTPARPTASSSKAPLAPPPRTASAPKTLPSTSQKPPGPQSKAGSSKTHPSSSSSRPQKPEPSTSTTLPIPSPDASSSDKESEFDWNKPPRLSEPKGKERETAKPLRRPIKSSEYVADSSSDGAGAGAVASAGDGRDNNDDDDEDPRGGPPPLEDISDSDDDDDDGDHNPRPPLAPASDDGDDDPPLPRARGKLGSTQGSKPRPAAPAAADDDDDDDDPPLPPPRRTLGSTKGPKPRRAAPVVDDDNSDDDAPLPRPRGRLGSTKGPKPPAPSLEDDPRLVSPKADKPRKSGGKGRERGTAASSSSRARLREAALLEKQQKKAKKLGKEVRKAEKARRVADEEGSDGIDYGGEWGGIGEGARSESDAEEGAKRERKEVGKLKLKSASKREAMEVEEIVSDSEEERKAAAGAGGGGGGDGEEVEDGGLQDDFEDFYATDEGMDDQGTTLQDQVNRAFGFSSGPPSTAGASDSYAMDVDDESLMDADPAPLPPQSDHDKKRLRADSVQKPAPAEPSTSLPLSPRPVKTKKQKMYNSPPQMQAGQPAAQRERIPQPSFGLQARRATPSLIDARAEERRARQVRTERVQAHLSSRESSIHRDSRAPGSRESSLSRSSVAPSAASRSDRPSFYGVPTGMDRRPRPVQTLAISGSQPSSQATSPIEAFPSTPDPFLDQPPTEERPRERKVRPAEIKADVNRTLLARRIGHFQASTPQPPAEAPNPLPTPQSSSSGAAGSSQAGGRAPQSGLHRKRAAATTPAPAKQKGAPTLSNPFASGGKG